MEMLIYIQKFTILWVDRLVSLLKTIIPVHGLREVLCEELILCLIMILNGVILKRPLIGVLIKILDLYILLGNHLK